MSNYSENWDTLRDASSRRQFLNIPQRAAEVGLLKELIDCLKSYEFITIKLSDEAEELGGGVDALISDYAVALNVVPSSEDEFVKDLAVLEQIQQGLNEHRDIIDREKSYLPEKLWGFLISRRVPGVSEFLEQIKRSNEPWMRPVSISDRGDRSSIKSIQTASSSKKAFCLSSDQFISSWSLNDGTELESKSFSGLKSFAITPSGKVVVMGFSDGTLEIYDAETSNKLDEQVEFHKNEITSITISTDLKWLVSCSNDNTIKTVELDKKSKQFLHTLYHPDPVTCIAILQGTNRLVSGSSKGVIRIWNLEGMKELGAIVVYSNMPVTSIVAIPNTNFIAVSSVDSLIINICDLVSQTRVEPPLEGCKGGVNSLSITPNGKLLISGSVDKVVRVWDWHMQKTICSTERGSSICACTVAPDGETIVIGEKSGQVCLFAIQGVNYLLKNSKIKLNFLDQVWSGDHEKQLFSSVFPKRTPIQQSVNQPLNLEIEPRLQTLSNPPSTRLSRITFPDSSITYKVVGGLVALGLLLFFGRVMTSTTTKPALEPALEPGTTSREDRIENMNTVTRMDNTFLCKGVGGIGGEGMQTISTGGIDLRAGQTHTIIVPLAEGDSIEFQDMVMGEGSVMNGATFLVSAEDPSANLLKVDELVNHENSLIVNAGYTGDYKFIFRLPEGVASQKSSIASALTCH